LSIVSCPLAVRLAMALILALAGDHREGRPIARSTSRRIPGLG
jgi:hypothetical protein